MVLRADSAADATAADFAGDKDNGVGVDEGLVKSEVDDKAEAEDEDSGSEGVIGSPGRLLHMLDRASCSARLPHGAQDKLAFLVAFILLL